MPPPVPRLPVPRTTAGVEGLRTLIAEPSTALIAIDFDGTLAPIVMQPGAARPHPRASAALRDLAESVGAVAVVTGRPAGLAAELLGFTAKAPGRNVSVVGHYGLETWTSTAGVVPVAGVDARGSPRVDQVRAALPALLLVSARRRGRGSRTRVQLSPSTSGKLRTRTLRSRYCGHRCDSLPRRRVYVLSPVDWCSTCALAAPTREPRSSRSCVSSAHDQLATWATTSATLLPSMRSTICDRLDSRRSRCSAARPMSRAVVTWPTSLRGLMCNWADPTQ